MVLVSSTVTGNSAATGGGIAIRRGGLLQLTDNSVTGNTGGDTVYLLF